MVLYAFFAVLTIGFSCMVTGVPVTISMSGTVSKSTGRMPVRRCMDRRQALSLTALSALFILLTALASLRIEVGNDYGKYVDIFLRIHE